MYILEKYAERQGKTPKRTHKIRKTYASLLNVTGVPLDVIREQLGHNDLQNTMNYIYNPLTEIQTYELIKMLFPSKILLGTGFIIEQKTGSPILQGVLTKK